MKTILFQGDSITDAGRNRAAEHDLGGGYPCLVGAKLGRRCPEKYQFLNRGIGGDKVTNLIGRWKRDCINLQPDYLSILVGVNDVWHELDWREGTDTDTFMRVYDLLLEHTVKALPETKILLLEPYVLEDALEPDKREDFKSGVREKREAVRKLAEKYHLVTVPLQDIFDSALKEAPALYWTAEGIHPTKAGHQLICDAWMEAFEKIK